MPARTVGERREENYAVLSSKKYAVSAGESVEQCGACQASRHTPTLTLQTSPFIRWQLS